MEDFTQPRKHPFECVLGEIFTMPAITRAMVRQVTPAHVTVPTFDQLRPSARRQMFRAMEKCVTTFGKVLMPSDIDAVVTACMVDTELNKFISSMIHG